MASTPTKRRKQSRVRESAAEAVWVTRAMVEAIHEALLREHGGSSGIRDAGSLDSALNRPRHKFRYGEVDRAALAPAYACGISRNHPFVDGNKRTAFQVMYVFLGLNDVEVDADEPEVVDIMVRLAAGTVTEAALAKWISSKTQPRT